MSKGVNVYSFYDECYVHYQDYGELEYKINKATNIIEDTLTIMKESRCSKLWYYDKDNMKHEWDFEHLIPKIEEFLEILKGENNE